MKLIYRQIYINQLVGITNTPASEATFKREITPLLQIRDAYPKLLLARTRNDETDYEGIRIIDIPQWLMA